MSHGIKLYEPGWGYEKPLPPLFGNDVKEVRRAVRLSMFDNPGPEDIFMAERWQGLTVYLASTPELNAITDEKRGRKMTCENAFYDFFFTFWRSEKGRYWPDNVIYARVEDDFLAIDNGRTYELPMHRREQFMVMRKLIADIEARQKIHIDSLFAEEESA